MKKLSELLRSKSVPAIHFGSEEVPELNNLQRVHDFADHHPEQAPEIHSDVDHEELKDIAQKLWCNAGHF